ncbi:MAG TPA: hypothetical protein VH281_03625 [Gaiellaceae bacterium]|jgi:hypothetical protein
MEPTDLVQTGQARRLAHVRQQGGWEVGELALLLDISFEAYRDLEDFDEEIVDCISFNQLTKLASTLGLDLREFFDAGSIGRLTFAEFAVRIQRSAGVHPASLAAFEERVGWELRRHLEDPETFAELPAIALADIGAAVGVDWRSFLPDGPSAVEVLEDG